MDKIKYTCKNCGWETSIREQWGDLKPKRCMNKRCNTSFLAQPDSLIIKRPEKESEPKSFTKSNKSYKYGNKNSKRKESSSAVEQQSTESEASE